MRSAHVLAGKRTGDPRRGRKNQKLVRALLLLTIVFESKTLLQSLTTRWTVGSLQVAETVEVVNLPATCGINLKVNRSCTRVLHGVRESKAGLGHQISELVFFALLGKLYGAALRLEPFTNTPSDHKSSHGFANSFLGLNVIFKSLETHKGLRINRLDDIENTDCGVVFEGSFRECPGGNCFKTPLMHDAFASFAPCFRLLSKRHGSWKKYDPYRKSTFNVFWHVRVGDRMPYGPRDDYFRNIYAGLETVLSSIPNVHHHICGEWNRIDRRMRDSFKLHFLRFLGVEKTHFIALSLKDSLAYMLHSDMLIGSGSSLSAIVPLFSEKPLYLNVKPKHGWNFFAEHFEEAIQVTDQGVILTPTWELQRLLVSRISRTGS